MSKLKNTLATLVLALTTSISNNSKACEIYTTPAFGNTPPQTIIEQCSPLPSPHYSTDATPTLFEKALGRWKAEAIYNPGSRHTDCWGRVSIKTATIITKQGNDFVQLNPNGTFCEKFNGVINTGFFGLEYNPHQNIEGTINLYHCLNPRTLAKSGKIEVDNDALRISYPNNWNYVFRK